MLKYPGKAWFKASADRDDFDDSPHPFEAEDVFPDRRPPLSWLNLARPFEAEDVFPDIVVTSQKE